MAKPFRPPNPALPYREDCWSEGETDVLIDAWGDRYVEVNHGSLRQQQWQEVADAVNSRPCDARRPPRTDVQCKNRIDTLKKKYKVERSKTLPPSSNHAVGSASQWKFYHKLDELIGSSSAPVKKPLPKASVAPPLALSLPLHRKGAPLPAAAAVRPVERRRPPVVEDSFYRRNLSTAAAVGEVEEEEESEDSASRSSLSSFRERSGMKRTRNGKGKGGDEEEGEDEEGVRELSKAILRLAEVYERVEVEKQRQMMELEKQKMEFAKGLEFQRMQIFLDSQVRLAKTKRWR